MIEEELYKLQKYMVTPEDIFSNKEYKVRLKLKKEDNLILINAFSINNNIHALPIYVYIFY